MKHSSLFFFFLHLSCILSGQINYTDCVNAQVLCDKSPIFINSFSDYGNFQESFPGSCFRNDFVETNSVWLKWKVAESGSFDFTILPINADDDSDFVLYRLKGFDSCPLKEVVRCMAAGPILGNEDDYFQNCTGATGLRAGADRNSLSSGCPEDSENFLSPVEIKAGEYYAIFINNFHSTGGILIEWGGTGTFQQIPEKCSPLSGPSTSHTFHNSGHVEFSEAFPNPASNQVTITATSEHALSGQLQIIGPDGQLEFTKPFMLSPGGNVLDLPTANLRSGVHFIRLRTDDKIHVLRFVKH